MVDVLSTVDAFWWALLSVAARQLSSLYDDVGRFGIYKHFRVRLIA